MKDLKFLGNTREFIDDSSVGFKRDFGQAFRKIQNGITEGLDIKPFSTIGQGVMELRIWLDDGTYRAIYTAKFEDTVYVLHIFKKKTQQTAKKEIELARKRFVELQEIRRQKDGK